MPLIAPTQADLESAGQSLALGVLPLPSGTITAEDLAQLGWLYRHPTANAPIFIILTDPRWIVVATPEPLVITAEVFGSMVTAPDRSWEHLAPVRSWERFSRLASITVTATLESTIVQAPSRSWQVFAEAPVTPIPAMLFLGGWVEEGWVAAEWIELFTILATPTLHTTAPVRSMTISPEIPVSVQTAPARMWQISALAAPWMTLAPFRNWTVTATVDVSVVTAPVRSMHLVATTDLVTA